MRVFIVLEYHQHQRGKSIKQGGGSGTGYGFFRWDPDPEFEKAWIRIWYQFCLNGRIWIIFIGLYPDPGLIWI